jgi:probable F420-dependent oxidoreductase
MKIWQVYFSMEADQLVDVTKICEEVGFDGVLVSDHLLDFEQCRSRYPYTPDGKPPFIPGTSWPECWTTIAVLASVTKRLLFGTSIYLMPLRHPIDAAKAIATVASFSGGRLVLGAGAGWMREEYDAMGVDFRTRSQRFDECIYVFRKLCTGRLVEHHGRFFDFPKVQMSPVPREPIPIYIGGMSRAAFQRAARLGDGWIGMSITPEETLEHLRTLNHLRAEAGRQHLPFDAVVPVIGDDVDQFRRLEDAGLGGLVNSPLAFRIGPGSTLQQKRAYLESYAEKVILKLKR